MNEEETQKLLDEASGLYNDGRYDDAIAIWKSILEVDPDNERATEGIKMANLLTSDWEPSTQAEAPAAAPPLDPELLERVEQGVRRVEELLAAGDLDAAREGSEALGQIAPDHPGVQACTARVEAAANPSAFVQEQLAMARHYLMLGEIDEAAKACRKVLAVDPNDTTAQEMLQSQLGGGGVETAAPPQTPEPAMQEPPLELTLDAEQGAPSLELPDEPAAAPPPAAAAGEEGKIAELLAEGDALQAQGALEQAIDAWSRIFIIQDTHPEAEARIDAARRALDGQARQMEERLIRAGDLEKEGRLGEAAEELQAVLAVRPHHAEAKGRLQEIQAKIDAGGADVEAIPLEAADEIPPPPAEATPPPAEGAPPPPAAPSRSAVDVDEASPLPTPPPKPPERAAATAAAPKKRGGFVMAAVVVVAAGVLGYAGWLAWQAFFPEVPGDEVPVAAPSLPPAGAKAAARRDQPPEETAGEPGQEPAGQAGPAGSGTPSPPRPRLSPEQARVRSADLVKTGRSQFQAGDHAAALAQFEEALQLDPTNFDAQDWRDRARAEVEKVARFEKEMESVRELFEERDFRNALYKLYRVEAPSPQETARVERWTGRCWYDWGVFLLQSSNPADAVEKFQETLALRPDDAEAARHLEVAERYSSRAVDASFRSYAERLQLRPLE